MAAIVIVQSYPYDAFAGGDGAYIQSLGQFLIDCGHQVSGLISDTTRGRTNPFYRSAYPIDRYREWKVRGAIRLGARTFLAIRPRSFAFAILSRFGLLRRSQASDGTIHDENGMQPEAIWVMSKLKAFRPDVVILCFDAIHFSHLLRQLGIPLFCLPGSPMFARELRLNGETRGEADRKIKPSRGHLRIAQALLHADRVGFASYSDRDYAAKYLGVENGLVVGMGFPRQTATIAADEPIVLFVGNMTQPNVEGLNWFITRVWPKIRGVYPSARFRVVGRVAAGVPPGISGIEAIGPVQDLGTEYARSQVVIAPLLSGTTGVKVKVAEAMAFGRPLVTTSVGIDPGQRDQLDPGTLVADTEQDFATSVLDLLTQPNVRIEKGRGAKRVYKSWFSQEACYREVAQWIDAVAKPAP